MRDRQRGQRTYALVALDTPTGGFWRALWTGGSPRVTTSKSVANTVCSRTDTGWHMPVLDLDVPHSLVPSSKRGHAHLYIDVRMPWRKYAAMLLVLRWCRVLERGFVLHSLRRRGTYARLPHIRKPGFENHCLLCGDGLGQICAQCRGLE